MRKVLPRYFKSGWLPALVYFCLLGAFMMTAIFRWKPLAVVAKVLLGGGGVAFLGLVAASLWNLLRKRWKLGMMNLLWAISFGVVTVFALGFLMFASMFGPSEDGFADDLTIPEGIEIANPDPEATDAWGVNTPKGSDLFEEMVRKALAVPGNDATEFVPEVPSLRKASSYHSYTFREYIEASPDWHVFMEQGNRFAFRSWSYGREPQYSLHGYISEFGGDARFQTRCLLCLDRKQWSRYAVQHVREGTQQVKPEMRLDNNLHESRVMIECGGVWVEVFEQSDKPERRLTKATIAALEKEFEEYLRNPKDAVAAAKTRSGEWASRHAGKDGHPFRLVTGMQPGIYGVVYSLNPGEPGFVYLKAFEITKGTPLSVDRLEERSKTRMTWSREPSERFGAQAEFTIYEGDWGKPYAARFEVWFRPDSSKPERKLAERVFKIEGWQR